MRPEAPPGGSATNCSARPCNSADGWRAQPALSGAQVAACGTLIAASLRITRVVDDTAEHDAPVPTWRVDAAYRPPGNSPAARRLAGRFLGVYFETSQDGRMT